MNPDLGRLHPYPFERLRILFSGVKAAAALRPVSLALGEPKHPTPGFIRDALNAASGGLANYPSTLGTRELRLAIAQWLTRRYGIAAPDPDTQILPVNGTREALFAIAQTVVDRTRKPARIVCPNPFYQIYEGAALLAGAEPLYVNIDPQRPHAVDYASLKPADWACVQLLYACSPGNPTGQVMRLEDWETLFSLSDQYGFTIVADECYSEIYFKDSAPMGALEAASQLGRTDYRRLLVFHSLSKRSSVPGLRSGFVAGDAQLVAQFLLYRTYHGCALGPPVQAASALAWSEEAHVEESRALYRQKFAEVTPLIASVLDTALPDAAFYLWAKTPIDDEQFAQRLYATYNVAVLPGSYLGRSNQGVNPGAGYVRLALVAEPAECLEAARRIVQFVHEL
ncbi:MAG: succinyldiaminopimelate transaminase [Burkholderiaceae bacterium]|jgi:N-succinyldiaminopimelate aminotransferase